jgi:hypothetical protein
MKVSIAVLVGFVLGALSVFAFRPTRLVRSDIGVRHIHVVELNKGGDLFLMPSQGSQVVGFSCTGTPEQEHCLIATAE